METCKERNLGHEEKSGTKYGRPKSVVKKNGKAVGI